MGGHGKILGTVVMGAFIAFLAASQALSAPPLRRAEPPITGFFYDRGCAEGYILVSRPASGVDRLRHGEQVRFHYTMDGRETEVDAHYIGRMHTVYPAVDRIALVEAKSGRIYWINSKQAQVRFPDETVAGNSMPALHMQLDRQSIGVWRRGN